MPNEKRYRLESPMELKERPKICGCKRSKLLRKNNSSGQLNPKSKQDKAAAVPLIQECILDRMQQPVNEIESVETHLPKTTESEDLKTSEDGAPKMTFEQDPICLEECDDDDDEDNFINYDDAEAPTCATKCMYCTLQCCSDCIIL